MGFFSLLATMFMGMFWMLRVVVALMYSLESDFAVQPLNINVEIALLFVTLLAIILVVRRNMLGALIYLISYGIYFGIDLYQSLASGMADAQDYGAVFISAVAMILAVLVYLDLSFSKDNKTGMGNKKTNWFYGTDKYERKKESWEDTNQY